MPKKYHNRIYVADQIVYIDPDENRLNSKEAFLLHIIADLAIEVSCLKVDMDCTRLRLQKIEEKIF